MKKRIISVLVLFLVIFPIVIKADNYNYTKAVEKANNYIRLSSFSDKKKYILLEEEVAPYRIPPYIFEDGVLYREKDGYSTFSRGGMLSKTEYELSQINEMSYLTLGQKYWLLTPGNGNDEYYVENYLDSKNKNESSGAGVRSTIYAKPGVFVVGKGTYNIPWEFRVFHTVKITPKENGSVDCIAGSLNCKKKNTTVTKTKIETGTDASFYVDPTPGYKYQANDTCNLKKVSGNTYKISNITNDIRCILEFYPRTYTLLLLAGSGITYKTVPSPDIIYLKYTVGTFSDLNATTTINKITPPTRTGYKFKGYYYGDTKVIDEDGTIIESQRKAITDFNLSGPDVQELIAHWEINKVYIKYKIRSGETLTPKTTHGTEGDNYWTVDSDNYIYKNGKIYQQKYDYNTVLEPNYLVDYNQKQYLFIRKKGNKAVENQEWICVGGDCLINKKFDQKYAYNSQEICDSSNGDCTAVFSVNWKQCVAGTQYNEDDGTCDACPPGTFNTAAASLSCTYCAVGSYTNEYGQTSCKPCQPSGATGTGGTTTDVGQSSCTVSCGKSHVSTWQEQVWTNNETNPICTIGTCELGYHLTDNNTCEPNVLKITYNAAGGSDKKGSTAIPYTDSVLYTGTNFSGQYGLPDYIGESTWKLVKAGYVGSRFWLVGSAASDIKVSTTDPFATNIDLARAMGVLESFQNNALTEVNLYAEWIPCGKGYYSDGSKSTEYCDGCGAGKYSDGDINTTCNNCQPGKFSTGNHNTTCTDCAIGSTSSEGKSVCTACKPSDSTGTDGTTTGVGQSSCNATCNKSHVSEWQKQVWTNNSTNPICEIKTCETGYHLENNNCIDNGISVCNMTFYAWHPTNGKQIGSITNYMYIDKVENNVVYGWVKLGTSYSSDPSNRLGDILLENWIWKNGNTVRTPAQVKTYITNSTNNFTTKTIGSDTYVYLKWYDYNYGGTYLFSACKQNANNCNKCGYTVIYDANGGTGAPSPQSQYSDQNLTLSSTTPTRDGYTFKNWNKKSDGSSTSYNAGATYSEKKTVTLYAQWEENAIHCNAGNYLPRSSNSCATCVAGYYCVGGDFSPSTTEDKGLTVCPDNKSSLPGASSVNDCYAKTGTLAESRIWAGTYRYNLNSTGPEEYDVKRSLNNSDGYTIRVGYDTWTYSWPIYWNAYVIVKLPQDASNIKISVHDQGGADGPLKYHVSATKDDNYLFYHTEDKFEGTFNYDGKGGCGQYCFPKNVIPITYNFRKDREYYIYFWSKDTYMAFRYYKKSAGKYFAVTYGLNETAPETDSPSQ